MYMCYVQRPRALSEHRPQTDPDSACAAHLVRLARPSLRRTPDFLRYCGIDWRTGTLAGDVRMELGWEIGPAVSGEKSAWAQWSIERRLMPNER